MTGAPCMCALRAKPPAETGIGRAEVPQRSLACSGSTDACSADRMPALKVNRAGDAFEQEADRAAERVLGLGENAFEGENDRRERPHTIHRRIGADGGGLPDAPPLVGEVLRSPGRPLDPATRAFFEPRFGHDFGRVRVHTGAQAAASARAIDARAYTVGADIVLAADRYDAQSASGRRLLAHELAHVVQQSSGSMHRVQRQNYWALPNEPNYGAGPGTRSHDHAFMRMRANNPNLFTDVPVFGATARGLEADAIGYADLFAASGLIGVRFDDDGCPAFPFTSKRTYYGNAQLTEAENRRRAHPAANRKSSCCGNLFTRGTDGICRLDQHEAIEIGELKPENSAGEILGTPQVMAYRDAFRQLRKRINDWVAANPTLGHPPGVVWNPPIDVMEDDAVVPRDLRLLSSRSEWTAMILEYDATGRRTATPRTEGTMRVRYRSPGILAYRWFPLYEIEEVERQRAQRRGRPDAGAQETLAGLAVASTAVVVAAGVMRKKRQRARDAAKLSQELKLKRAAAQAELAEMKAERELAKKGGKQLGKRALKQVVSKGTTAISVLTAVSAAYLLASGEAQAAPIGGGEDPLLMAMKALAGKNQAVPEPLRTLIENDAELRRAVAEAASGGDMSAAQRAASDRAAEILAQNLDQFSEEEIAALLTATRAAAQDVAALEPTLEQLEAAAAARGMAPGGGEGMGGTAAGAPAQLPGASENVQRLWEAVTGPEGVAVDAAFAERFVATLGNELSDKALEKLLEELAASEELADPDELLARLRSRLDAVDAEQAPPGTTGGAESAGGGSTAAGEAGATGTGNLVETPQIERVEPAPTGGLDTEETLAQLRSELAERPASDWPTRPGVLWLRRSPAAAAAAGATNQPAKLLSVTGQGEPCLQYLEVRNMASDRILVVAASPRLCRRGDEFVPQPSAVRPGKTYQIGGTR